MTTTTKCDLCGNQIHFRSRPGPQLIITYWAEHPNGTWKVSRLTEPKNTLKTRGGYEKDGNHCCLDCAIAISTQLDKIYIHPINA